MVECQPGYSTALCRKIEPVECCPQRGRAIDAPSIILLFAIRSRPMNNEHEHPDINGLKAQVAALEELIEVYEGTSLEQANRLEQALRLREQAEEDLTRER